MSTLGDRQSVAPASAAICLPCKICGGETLELGRKTGRFLNREFQIRRCPKCLFACVANPWVEYDEVYSDSYYSGNGADPLVDYALDLQSPAATAHRYEWRGILRAVRALTPVTGSTRWLEFGCGAAGLVRYLRDHNVDAVGYEEGAIAERVRAAGIPLLDSNELTRCGPFDIVTAIEVLEHVTDPLAVLTQIRGLLRPGGLFFFTTGNARRYRNDLLRWRYLVPEVHVSFFEPETLDLALQKTGFRTEWPGYLPGFTDILHYRILKTAGIKHRSVAEALLPWPVLSRSAQFYFKFFAHPVAWAR